MWTFAQTNNVYDLELEAELMGFSGTLHVRSSKMGFDDFLCELLQSAKFDTQSNETRVRNGYVGIHSEIALKAVLYSREKISMIRL